jgi:cyclopropane fatty-acyl-phospholipid synthase-like methyltransferase
MKRVPEPEIMDNEDQALAYAQADFSDSNQLFVDMFVREYGHNLSFILDLGSGPADILIRLEKALPGVHITGVDASEPMVRIARDMVRENNMDENIKIIEGKIPGLTPIVTPVDAILSKDLLHHMPDPALFWNDVIRIGKSGTIIFVMDLFRPQSKEEARRIVESVSGNEDLLLKADFYHSLLSSFSIPEVKKQIKKAGLNLEVVQVSARHYLVNGVIE